MHRTKIADHFLETPEYEQLKYHSLVILFVIRSIKLMNLKNKFCPSVDPATFTPPPNQNSWIRPCEGSNSPAVNSQKGHEKQVC